MNKVMNWRILNLKFYLRDRSTNRKLEKEAFFDDINQCKSGLPDPKIVLNVANKSIVFCKRKESAIIKILLYNVLNILNTMR